MIITNNLPWWYTLNLQIMVVLITMGKGEGNQFFRSIFQDEETSIKRFSNNDEDGDNDGEGCGGITNRFVLFLGSGNQAGQNHQTITKLEKTTGKGGGCETLT